MLLVVLCGLYGSFMGLSDLASHLWKAWFSEGGESVELFTSPCWLNHEVACEALGTAAKH